MAALIAKQKIKVGKSRQLKASRATGVKKQKSFVTNLKSKVNDWIYEYFTKPYFRPVQIFFEQLKVIYDYIPLLYQDRDWDQGYLLDMLIFKLKRMEQIHIHDKFHGKDRLVIAKQIRFSYKLLKKLSNDFYGKAAAKRHDEKWGKMKVDWIPRDDGGAIFSSSRPKAKTAKQKAKELKDFRHMMDHEYHMEERAAKNAFLAIAKYHRGWWS